MIHFKKINDDLKSITKFYLYTLPAAVSLAEAKVISQFNEITIKDDNTFIILLTTLYRMLEGEASDHFRGCYLYTYNLCINHLRSNYKLIQFFKIALETLLEESECDVLFKMPHKMFNGLSFNELETQILCEQYFELMQNEINYLISSKDNDSDSDFDSCTLDSEEFQSSIIVKSTPPTPFFSISLDQSKSLSQEKDSEEYLIDDLSPILEDSDSSSSLSTVSSFPDSDSDSQEDTEAQDSLSRTSSMHESLTDSDLDGMFDDTFVETKAISIVSARTYDEDHDSLSRTDSIHEGFIDSDLDGMFNDTIVKTKALSIKILENDFKVLCDKKHFSPTELACIIITKLFVLHYVKNINRGTTESDIRQLAGETIQFILKHKELLQKNREFIFKSNFLKFRHMIHNYLKQQEHCSYLSGIKFVLDTQIFQISDVLFGSDNTYFSDLIYLNYGSSSFVFQGNNIALKLLDAGQTLYANEIDMLKQLKNEHIVQYFGEINSLYYKVIFLELMRQQTVFEYLEKDDSKPEILQNYAKQVIAGLIYLRAMLIVHYDIKPENLLLTEKQGVTTTKISDFAFAVQFKDLQQTLPLKKSGSKHYANPYHFFSEKLELDYESTHRKIDMHSFGLTLFAMRTKYLPYAIKNGGFDIVRKQNNKPPKGFEKLSPEFKSIVSRCCLFSTEKKSISVEELKNTFEEKQDLFVKAMS